MHEQTAPRVLARLEGVDVLRGLAIIAVILLHISIRFILVDSVHLGRSWPSMLTSLVWRNGGNGVTVFFAVSGFLITLTSLRRFGSLNRLKLSTFYRIRFARIMPPLALLLLVLSALHLAKVADFIINPKHFTLARALVAALTFHLNWLEAARDAWLPACWTVLWSLSIEEMFYLFFPIVCVLLLRINRVGTALWFALAGTLVIMGPFARTVWAHTDLQQENSYLAGMSDIAAGCMAAWLTHRANRRGWVPGRTATLLMQVCGWLPILVFATWPRWHWSRPLLHLVGRSGLDDTLLAAGASLLAACFTLRSRPGRPWSAPLRWFGRHSYEIYLSHEFTVIVAVMVVAKYWPHTPSRPVVCLAVASIFVASALLGWVFAKFFSEPLNRRLRGAPLPTEPGGATVALQRQTITPAA